MPHHSEIDRRSLALHRRVAEKIRHDPELLNRARDTLARWRHTVAPATQPYLLQWQQVLDAGPEACIAMLEDESEQANLLRQSSPFTGVLTHAERFALLKSWKDRHSAPP